MAERRDGHSALHVKNGKLEKIDPHPPTDKQRLLEQLKSELAAKGAYISAVDAALEEAFDAGAKSTFSADAGRHEPDCAFADRIERELKELQAFKEDRGDPEYWVLQTFVANADRICAALRASRYATGMFDAVQLSEARFYRNSKEPIGILARAILRANGEMP